MALKVDSSEFEANAQRLAELMGISFRDLIVKTTTSWANTAARLTPAFGTKITGDGVRTLKRTAKLRRIVDLRNPLDYELSDMDKIQLSQRKKIQGHI